MHEPRSVRPGEQTLPTRPHPYTDIKSYHAHIYFDEDTFQKAALVEQIYPNTKPLVKLET